MKTKSTLQTVIGMIAFCLLMQFSVLAQAQDAPLDEPRIVAGVSVYPNPTTDGLLYIELKAEGWNGMVRIAAFDEIGQHIASAMIEVRDGYGRGEFIFEAEVRNGIYILEFYAEDGSFVLAEKVMLER